MALAFVLILIIGSGGSGDKPSTSKNLREPEKPAVVIPESNSNTPYVQEYDNTDDREYQDELAEEDLEAEGKSKICKSILVYCIQISSN